MFRCSVLYSLTSFPQDLLKKSMKQKSSLSWPRLWAKDPGCTCWCEWEKGHASCGGSTGRRCEYFLYFYIFHLPTNSYLALLYYSYWQGKHKTAAILGGSHQAAASSGWSNLLPWGCCLIIGQYEAILQILQTSIDFSILPSPPESLHHYGHAINATTGTTSKYPHLLWIFCFSISFSQSNKLSQSCKLHTSHTIISHSYMIFSLFQHSNSLQHIVFFYQTNLYPNAVLILTHIA